MHVAGLNTVIEKQEYSLSHYFAFALMCTSTRSLAVAVMRRRYVYCDIAAQRPIVLHAALYDWLKNS